MHTKPCIDSLAFTACNWELLCNIDLILLQKKAFSTQNMMVLLMNFYKINVGHIYPLKMTTYQYS